MADGDKPKPDQPVPQGALIEGRIVIPAYLNPGFTGTSPFSTAVPRHDDQHLDRFFLELLLGWEEPGQPFGPVVQSAPALAPEPTANAPSESDRSESDEETNT